jgi:hypothetical protein
MLILFSQIMFAYGGYILFRRNDFGGFFNDLPRSWFNLYVTFTLSNYPGISWPYYRNNRASILFFVLYILVVVHLFMNFLLALIFNSYKKIQDKEQWKYEQKLQEHFGILFKKIDLESKGFIKLEDLKEALGGNLLLKSDDRMQRVLSQASLLLEKKLGPEDLQFIMTYTATVQH